MIIRMILNTELTSFKVIQRDQHTRQVNLSVLKQHVHRFIVGSNRRIPTMAGKSNIVVRMIPDLDLIS